jgi:hypothetical protein
MFMEKENVTVLDKSISKTVTFSFAINRQSNVSHAPHIGIFVAEILLHMWGALHSAACSRQKTNCLRAEDQAFSHRVLMYMWGALHVTACARQKRISAGPRSVVLTTGC